MPDAGTYASEALGVAALERLARAARAEKARRWRDRGSGNLDREEAWAGWTG